MNYMETEWGSFQDIIPSNASPIQRKEMKRAFYAGGASSLSFTLSFLAHGRRITEEDLHKLSALYKELEQFGIDVEKGKA